MTLESCPETTVSFLQWNVPWILLLYAMCNETHLEYIMVEKIDTNFRIDLYGINNALIYYTGRIWSLTRVASNGANSSRKLIRVEDMMSGQIFTSNFCRVSNSAIFDFTRLFTAPRDDLISPHPHVRPVPRAKPAIQQP